MCIEVVVRGKVRRYVDGKLVTIRNWCARGPNEPVDTKGGTMIKEIYQELTPKIPLLAQT